MAKLKYYNFRNRFSPKLRGGNTYVEAERGTTLRQIVFFEDAVVASNRKHPQFGFVLPSGYVDYASISELFQEEIRSGRMEPIKTVPKRDFERIWKNHLATYAAEWEKTKEIYPIGTEVTGAIATFYPHGAIIELEPEVIAVTDSRILRASIIDTVVPGQQVHGKVSEYDEVNQWIVLSDPQAVG